MSDEQKNDKKEKVLHTRVSEGLEDELKRRAAELGVSVSNLVRNALTNTFDMVEHVVADTGRVVKTATAARPRSGMQVGTVIPVAGAPDPVRLGYQELVLSLNAVCESCNAIIAKGQSGAVAIFDVPGQREFLCRGCFAQQRSDDGDAEPSNTTPQEDSKK